MPVQSDLSVISCVFDKLTGALTVNGVAFGENQYPVSNVQYKKSDSAIWISVTSITAWADSQIGATITLPLPGGRYDVRVVNSDNETSTPLTGAFNNPKGGIYFFFDNGKKR